MGFAYGGADCLFAMQLYKVCVLASDCQPDPEAPDPKLTPVDRTKVQHIFECVLSQ